MKCGIRTRQAHRPDPIAWQPRLSSGAIEPPPIATFPRIRAGIDLDDPSVDTNTTRRAAPREQPGNGPSERLETNMVIKILPNDKGLPSGKLADVEVHFNEGALDGL